MTNIVQIQFELNEPQTWALAKLCKGIGLTDLRKLAECDAEAFEMAEALAALAEALAQKHSQ